VGMAYDEKRGRFDHHQGGISPRENGIPYASFGLVWKEFGEDICKSEKIAHKIDKVLIQEIDAKDNGLLVVQSLFKDVFPYETWAYLSNNCPTWKEEKSTIDAIFAEQVEFAKKVINRLIKVLADEEEGKQKVEEAYQAASDKRIVAMERYIPWEEVLSSHPEPLFAVYPGINGTEWSIQTARDDLSTYVNRKNIPAAWAGLRGKEFADATGVPDASFCHRGRFYATAKSREGAIKLAQLAADYQEG
jgi:uncharacterized UPF0160 family protein